MSIVITKILEDDIIKRLSDLAFSNNINDFEGTLRFISNSRFLTVREIPDYILESKNLRKNFNHKYIELLEKYSNAGFTIEFSY
jgi:hypothetical protein